MKAVMRKEFPALFLIRIQVLKIARTSPPSAAEQERLSRLMRQWDGEIQKSIEAIYGISDDERAKLETD